LTQTSPGPYTLTALPQKLVGPKRLYFLKQHIIYNITRGMSYHNILLVAELESLETRRNNQSRSFFQDICKPTSCLYHFIPPPRDTSVITRLRPTTSLPEPSLRTKKYCSFINFGLHHYQKVTANHYTLHIPSTVCCLF